MQDAQPVLVFALKAVALALAVASIVLSALGAGTVSLLIILLAIGLLALALASLIESALRRRVVRVEQVRPPVGRPARRKKRR